MNARHQKFVAEYCVDQIGWKAAERAGYKGTTHSLEVEASRLLRNAEIKAAIDAALQKEIAVIQKKSRLTKKKMLARLEAIAFSDMGDAFQVDANGKLTMNIADMKRSGFSKLVRKMKVLPGGKVEIDLHSVLPAAELICKMNGWVKESVEHSGSVGRPIELSPDQFKRMHSSPELAHATLLLAEALVPPPAAKTAEGAKK